MTKVSIITVNLNNIAGLKKTVASVISQSFQDFEYIIIDGGSTDGSKEFIESTSKHFLFWCSENDKGIYDAMNKGIKIATAEYLYFLNSGDIFSNNQILKTIENLMDEDIVYGDIEMGNENNIEWRRSPRELNFCSLLKEGLPHQAAFIKRDLFNQYGLYNCDLKICADWIFFIDVICKNNATYKYVPVTISSFDTKGISSLEESIEIIKMEKEHHLEKHYSAFIDYYRSTDGLVEKYTHLKNSRIRKLLSIIFKQLKI